MTTVSVRYITDDIDAAVDFYVERLGFNREMRPGPGFAMLSRGDLRLLLNQQGAGGEATHARWPGARARRLESHPDRGLRPRARGRVVTRGWDQLP